MTETEEKINNLIIESKNKCPELTWMEIILSFLDEKNLGVPEEDKIAVEELSSILSPTVLQCLYDEQVALRTIRSDNPIEIGFF